MPDSSLSAVIHAYDDHEVRPFPLYATFLDVVQRARSSLTTTPANPTTCHPSQMLTTRSVFTMLTAITIRASQDSIIMTSVMEMWRFS